MSRSSLLLLSEDEELPPPLVQTAAVNALQPAREEDKGMEEGEEEEKGALMCRWSASPLEEAMRRGLRGLLLFEERGAGGNVDEKMFQTRGEGC